MDRLRARVREEQTDEHPDSSPSQPENSRKRPAAVVFEQQATEPSLVPGAVPPLRSQQSQDLAEPQPRRRRTDRDRDVSFAGRNRRQSHRTRKVVSLVRDPFRGSEHVSLDMASTAAALLAAEHLRGEGGMPVEEQNRLKHAIVHGDEGVAQAVQEWRAHGEDDVLLRALRSLAL